MIMELNLVFIVSNWRRLSKKPVGGDGGFPLLPIADHSPPPPVNSRAVYFAFWPVSSAFGRCDQAAFGMGGGIGARLARRLRFRAMAAGKVPRTGPETAVAGSLRYVAPAFPRGRPEPLAHSRFRRRRHARQRICGAGRRDCPVNRPHPPDTACHRQAPPSGVR